MLCWTAAKQPRREGWVGRGYGNTPLASQLPYHTSLFPPGNPPAPSSLFLPCMGTSFMACAHSSFCLDHSLLSLSFFLNSGSFFGLTLFVSSSRKSSLLCPSPICLTGPPPWPTNLGTQNVLSKYLLNE